MRTGKKHFLAGTAWTEHAPATWRKPDSLPVFGQLRLKVQDSDQARLCVRSERERMTEREREERGSRREGGLR